ncbi:MAG: bifunctional phosphoribosylaminoimidazolecarboxamide formyltransferase/IMP cyclohydrolase [Anaerolineae bacterium]|nr:bifunctional phosphoribosylaminoimidazolecarboxamide formyltransferase/IMP cyclohydrolase [Anaerolineae bacterium]
MKIKRALLSVSNKEGLVEFGRGLAELGAELIATGGTARALGEAQLAVRPIEDVTGFPEILDGRVKTLHPAVHGGILARRDEGHLAELEAQGIAPIDLVAVNLYPFVETVAKPGTTLAEAIEQIDIGGVALLRAAAKNFAHVAAVSDPADYATVLAELREQGDLSIATRRRLALKAFRHTASYDAAISRYLTTQFEEAAFPAALHLNLTKLADLRYGENPHQQAALYSLGSPPFLPPNFGGERGGESPLGGNLLQGKALSYNNILDLDAAWRLVSDFAAPTLVIIKHGNPCGVASDANLADAFRAALASDPVSAFGSIIAANRPFDGEVALALGDLFVEAIAAPAFTAEAREVLAERPNCRLLEMSGTEDLAREMRSVRGGLLVQEKDAIPEDETGRKVVTERKPTVEELEALRFAWKVVKHVKSNAIVLAKGMATVGIGAGQMSRVDAVRLAIAKAGERARGAVLASDAFFPFPDGVEEAAKAGITAIVQPGGSRGDAAVIEAADARGLAMLFTAVRHFRH